MASSLQCFSVMPRSARHLPQAGMFHLIGRGNNRVRLFKSASDFLQFENTLYRYTAELPFYIHHYVLMRTHYHLLTWVEDTSKIANCLKAAQLCYFAYYKRKYEYKGHLWHGRYRSILIEDDRHWLQCGRYIELNPVYAGICSDPKQYKWSSYHTYAFGKRNELVRPVMSPQLVKPIAFCHHNYEYQEFVKAGIDLDYQFLKREYEREKSVCSGNGTDRIIHKKLGEIVK